MSKFKESFDGNIIGYCTGKTHNAKIGLWNDKTRKLVDLRRLNAKKIWLNKLHEGNKRNKISIVEMLIEQENKHMEIILQQIRDEHGDKISEVLRDGRLKFSILLDSLGGNDTTAYKFHQEGAIAAHSGKIDDVYVGREALSQAAGLFLASTNRFALESSEFLWHSSRSIKAHPDGSKKTHIFLETFEKKLIPLIQSTKQSKREKVKRFIEITKIEDPTDPEVILIGSNLKECGVIGKVYKTVRGLRNLFTKNTNIEIDEDSDDLPSTFFKNLRKSTQE